MNEKKKNKAKSELIEWIECYYYVCISSASLNPRMKNIFIINNILIYCNNNNGDLSAFTSLFFTLFFLVVVVVVAPWSIEKRCD